MTKQHKTTKIANEHEKFSQQQFVTLFPKHWGFGNSCDNDNISRSTTAAQAMMIRSLLGCFLITKEVNIYK